VDIPGSEPLRLDHLVLDVNGTITDRAELIDGVEKRVRRLREALDVKLVSADTCGNLDAIAETLGLDAERISRSEEKRAHIARLGAERCAAIGNGADDEPMLRVARLGIAVVGPVMATPTHPGQAGIGWERFAALREHVSLPLYAIGGLSPGDIAVAREHGAQGIAAIRGLWPRRPHESCSVL
jgi:soluble P-type ATPase